MPINIERIQRDILALAEFNATPGQGCTRFTYTAQDRQARDYLLAELAALELNVVVDGVGNIRARKEGTSSLPPVLVGSHIDTVRHGGKFDGILGVVVGLECLRALAEDGVVLRHPVELIVFAEEEGSSYMPLAGSKALTGVLSVEDLKGITNSAGLSMYDAARQFGLNPHEMPQHIIRPGDVMAMLELHVEQSVVLEREQLPVGIVQHVAGGNWLGVTLKGVANHAGATPMGYRNDPMAAAARIISSLGGILEQNGSKTAVATVGKMECRPNTPNVIPGEVFFTVDVRDIDAQSMESICASIQDMVQRVAEGQGVEWDCRFLVKTPPIELSQDIRACLAQSAADLGIPAKAMNSGALHDAGIMAQVCDVGLVFVPSKGGRSHVPQEDTDFEDIEKGAAVLLEGIKRLAGPQGR